mgnify:CR=1 FL=1
MLIVCGCACVVQDSRAFGRMARQLKQQQEERNNLFSFGSSKR